MTTVEKFEVDLDNCAREPIHIPGSIQQFGVLLSVNTEWTITHASANAESLFQIPASDLLGKRFDQLIPERTFRNIRDQLPILAPVSGAANLFGLKLSDSGSSFDLTIHRSAENIIIEFEEKNDFDHTDPISKATLLYERLRGMSEIERYCQDAVRHVFALTGFDRVMVYKFDVSGAGEVVAESATPGIGSFLGLHYPASDIPAQARELYKKNLIRIISDVSYKPIPILSHRDSEELPLDLSLSVLRSVSPIHVEYLENMNVKASMSISIMTEGKLWGLFACHHYSPRYLSLRHRLAADLYGRMFSLQLQNIERESEAALENKARAMNQRLLTSLSNPGSAINDLEDQLHEFSKVIPCDGMAMVIDNQTYSNGIVPSKEDLDYLIRFLNRTFPGQIYETNVLSEVFSDKKSFSNEVAGCLAIPISRSPKDYMIFFRQEYVRSVAWAGNPYKTVVKGPSGDRLTPRKSFEEWKQEVTGQSIPWSRAQKNIAESVRVTLIEIILRYSESVQSEKQRLLERQELLIAELNHRVRNILGLIRGLIVQSASQTEDPKKFVETISDRIHSLARAHEQITRENWGPGSLTTLLTTETEAYLGEKSSRVDLEGFDVLLNPQAFSTLALVVHELVTNSAKYGALKASDGRVNVKWKFKEDGLFNLVWSESGGPPVTVPTRRGFGSTIIERSIPHELGGSAKVSYAQSGLTAEFDIPDSFISSRSTANAQTRKGRSTSGSVAIEGAALVVEDNLVISLDAQQILEELGSKKVVTASNSKDALNLLKENRFDFAILDMNLGVETSAQVAKELLQKKVPFIFATGYGSEVLADPELAHVVLIRKPYTKNDVAAALEKSLAS